MDSAQLHGQKAKATRAAGLAVEGDESILHAAILREQADDVLAAGGAWQVSDAQLGGPGCGYGSWKTKLEIDAEGIEGEKRS